MEQDIRDSGGSFIAAGSCFLDHVVDHTQGGSVAGTTHRVQSTHDPIGLFGGGRNDETGLFPSNNRCSFL